MSTVKFTSRVYTGRMTNHPKNRTLSPKPYLGRDDSRVSFEGKGPFDIIVSIKDHTRPMANFQVDPSQQQCWTRTSVGRESPGENCIVEDTAVPGLLFMKPFSI